MGDDLYAEIKIKQSEFRPNLPAQSFQDNPHVAIEPPIEYTAHKPKRKPTNLFFDDLPVDLSGRQVIVARERNIQVSLIVSKIEIDLSAVVENVHLPCRPIA
jgi:hypothetical protein